MFRSFDFFFFFVFFLFFPWFWFSSLFFCLLWFCFLIFFFCQTLYSLCCWTHKTRGAPPKRILGGAFLIAFARLQHQAQHVVRWDVTLGRHVLQCGDDLAASENQPAKHLVPTKPG